MLPTESSTPGPSPGLSPALLSSPTDTLPSGYRSPARHHQRTPSFGRAPVKETLDACTSYDDEEDGGQGMRINQCATPASPPPPNSQLTGLDTTSSKRSAAAASAPCTSPSTKMARNLSALPFPTLNPSPSSNTPVRPSKSSPKRAYANARNPTSSAGRNSPLAAAASSPPSAASAPAPPLKSTKNKPPATHST